jgi:hypothetical protein
MPGPIGVGTRPRISNAASNVANNAANAANARETPLQTQGKMQELNLRRCKLIAQKVVSVNA